jgi:hypothetical protein
MAKQTAPDNGSLKEFLDELRNRRPDTKYRLLELLVEMGDTWHLVTEITKSAMDKRIAVSHLFENLIELSRISGFVETDFREKKYPRFSSFRVGSSVFPTLRRTIQDLRGK